MEDKSAFLKQFRRKQIVFGSEVPQPEAVSDEEFAHLLEHAKRKANYLLGVYGGIQFYDFATPQQIESKKKDYNDFVTRAKQVLPDEFRSFPIYP